MRLPAKTEEESTYTETDDYGSHRTIMKTYSNPFVLDKAEHHGPILFRWVAGLCFFRREHSLFWTRFGVEGHQQWPHARLSVVRHPWRWFAFELDVPTWSQTHSKHVASQTTSWTLEEAPGLLISWQWLCRSVVAAIQNSGPLGWDPQGWQWNDSLDKLLDQHFIQVHIHTLHPSTFYPNTSYPNNTQTSGINMYILYIYIHIHCLHIHMNMLHCIYEYGTWHSKELYGITWLYGMNLRISKTSFKLRSSVKAMRLQWPARKFLMILGRLGFLLLLLLFVIVVSRWCPTHPDGIPPCSMKGSPICASPLWVCASCSPGNFQRRTIHRFSKTCGNFWKL